LYRSTFTLNKDDMKASIVISDMMREET
jgi:hypothetical protein